MRTFTARKMKGALKVDSVHVDGEDEPGKFVTLAVDVEGRRCWLQITSAEARDFGRDLLYAAETGRQRLLAVETGTGVLPYVSQ